jgi:hypothetical protein
LFGFENDRRRSGVMVVTLPRPVFFTCPARSDIGKYAGETQPVHYVFVVDRQQSVHPNRLTWKFRDRPLLIEDQTPQHWYVGYELTPEAAEEQFRSHLGPHVDGAYLESDGLGGTAIRERPQD